MTRTTCYMERPAVMPTATPMGAVGLGQRYGTGSTMIPSMRHLAAVARAAGNAVKPWAFGIGRQVGLTTDRSARHLGRRPST